MIWPVACDVGRTCFVQNFFDHGDGAQPRDHKCGPRTYARHDGTDIRLADTQLEVDGVAVLAAAAGRVLRTRDGVNDVSIRTTGLVAVAGHECGNGLVIDHGDGWSTQYCHLKRGSIAVIPNQAVEAGARLGYVGLSGETEVPHLHLTVRYNGIAIDPFAYEQAPNTCSGGRSLWATRLSDELKYQQRETINFGFASHAATMESIESGEIRHQLPEQKSEALVAYVRAIGLQRGDEQFLSVQFPDGTALAEYHVPPLQANKAEFFAITGRRRETTWPQGTYAATFRISNNGAEVLLKTFHFEMRP